MAVAPTRRGTGSLRKALRLVTELGAADPDGLRLTELVGRTDTDSSTAYRMLSCLVDEGFLQKVAGKRYRLGPRVFELGLAAGQHFNRLARAHDTLHDLSDRLGVSSFLSVRSGIETVYLDRAEGPTPFPGLRGAIGTRLPIGIGSAGIAMLAAMPAPEADALIDANASRYRAFGRDTARILRHRLDRAKADGYARTTSFLRPDVGSLGVMLPGHRVGPPLAVSLVCTAQRLAEDAGLIAALGSAAHDVAAAIGHRS